MSLYKFFSSVPFFRVFTRAVQGFYRDECSVKATVLTYYSMFSLVPVTAVLFGIAKGFGLDEIFIENLKSFFQDHPEIADKVIEYVNHALAHAKGSVIAGLGVLLLFWTVYMLLMSIEQAFNEIWKTSSQRSFFRMLSDYLAVVIFCPALFLLSSSLFYYVITTLSEFASQTGLDYINPVLKLGLSLAPLLSSWLLFTFLYLFIPNATVHIRYALSAGILAGTAFQLLQYLFIKLQLWFASYGAIYGSFAVFPLFLIWMQLSWWIALFGAEICYHASEDKKESAHLKLQKEKTFPIKKGVLALYLACELAKRSLREERPATLIEFSKSTGVPYYNLKEIMDELKNAGLVWESSNTQTESTTYSLAKSMDRVRISNIILATSDPSNKEIQVAYSDNLFNINQKMQKFKEEVLVQKTNYSLSELVEISSKS